jgi:hypothetical protein
VCFHLLVFVSPTSSCAQPYLQYCKNAVGFFPTLSLVIMVTLNSLMTILTRPATRTGWPSFVTSLSSRLVSSRAVSARQWVHAGLLLSSCFTKMRKARCMHNRVSLFPALLARAPTAVALVLSLAFFSYWHLKTFRSFAHLGGPLGHSLLLRGRTGRW